MSSTRVVFCNKSAGMTRVLWLTLSLLYIDTCMAHSYQRNPPIYYASWIEKLYYPGAYTERPPLEINGTDELIPDPTYSPDFRLEEPHFTPFESTWNKETERPYRLSPADKAGSHWKKSENPYLMACYCCTVYRRLTLLGGCMVITTRHILTTATSTEIILRNYRNEPNLEGILGFWYDITANVFNSSLYGTPARIHYHNDYVRDYEVNVSHPIPCLYDLALWAATFRFYGFWIGQHGIQVCQRAVSSWSQYQDSVPREGDQWTVVGFQFMKAYARNPMPWFKYGVRTTKIQVPCPKTEWHWFHCTRGYFTPLGVDSGAGMHFQDRSRTWRIDGAVGMGAFTMQLRSLQNVQYFTVLDTYPVLDWLYYATMNYQKNVFLDSRFADTKYKAPVLYYGEHLPTDYIFGAEYSPYHPPNYRR